MPAKRMNRDEFFAKMSPLGEDRLRKALWNLYWRGSAPMRERIEAELDPAGQDRTKKAAAQPPDPEWVLYEVRGFARLARAGSYLGGDREVTPTERSRWRVTFRRLTADAQDALRDEDAGPAEEALALMIDLACETRNAEYFRSGDPVEAARFVVSDAAAMLWRSLLDRHGFQAFAGQAAAQLIRWEARYGWTRGWGGVSARETTLASVIARMLPAPDMWATFTDRYLDALDKVARTQAAGRVAGRAWSYRDDAVARGQRTSDLSAWHGLLLERLAGSQAGDRLDRLARHGALGGPELMFFQARLAGQRGDLDAARKLVQDCLQDLPGHEGFAGYAVEIGADLPPRARQLAEERAAAQAAGVTGPR